jgi:hypothetical protein
MRKFPQNTHKYSLEWKIKHGIIKQTHNPNIGAASSNCNFRIQAFN